MSCDSVRSEVLESTPRTAAMAEAGEELAREAMEGIVGLSSATLVLEGEGVPLTKSPMPSPMPTRPPPSATALPDPVPKPLARPATRLAEGSPEGSQAPKARCLETDLKKAKLQALKEAFNQEMEAIQRNDRSVEWTVTYEAVQKKVMEMNQKAKNEIGEDSDQEWKNNIAAMLAEVLREDNKYLQANYQAYVNYKKEEERRRTEKDLKNVVPETAQGNTWSNARASNWKGDSWVDYKKGSEAGAKTEEEEPEGGNDGGKSAGKGKNKGLQEKLRRISEYNLSDDVNHGGDRKVMWEAWSEGTSRIEESKDTEDLGTGYKRKFLAPETVVDVKNFVSDPNLVPADQVTRLTASAIGDLRERMTETQSYVRNVAATAEKASAASLVGKIRFHGFEFGYPAIRNREAIIKEVAVNCGLLPRDIKDVQETDRYGNLHKTVVATFRNESRCDAFCSRFYRDYSKNGMQVWDPIEYEDKKGRGEDVNSMQPWTIWISKVQTEEAEHQEKLFKAVCSVVHAWTNEKEIEKVWGNQIIGVSGTPVIKINYDEVLGRAVIHARSDWYPALQVELPEAVMQKCGTRRDQALFHQARQDNNEEGMKELCAIVAGTLPWMVTVANDGDSLSNEEPVEALRRRTDFDNKAAAAKGAMKGSKKKGGNDGGDDGDEEAQGKGKSRGKGKNRGKGGKGKSDHRDYDSHGYDSWNTSEAARNADAEADKK